MPNSRQRRRKRHNEKLQRLDPETVREIQEHPDAVLSLMFSGPLPLPQHLREYNEIIPHGAVEILEMAKREQIHRHHKENEEIGALKRGQWFALIVSLVVIGAAAFFLERGHDIAGYGSILTALAALIGTFVFKKAK